MQTEFKNRKNSHRVFYLLYLQCLKVYFQYILIFSPFFHFFFSSLCISSKHLLFNSGIVNMIAKQTP